MQTILLIIIGGFLIYRLMRVEDRMNKMEHDSAKERAEKPEKKDTGFKQFHN